jgi:uncharacterized protein YraI
MIGRLQFCALAFVVLATASAAAEPARVISPANLRAGPATDQAIVAKLPAGATVQVSNCREWCAVDWQGKKGFAIATALDRSGRTPARRTAASRDPYATDSAAKGEVPMSAGPYEAPGRYYGPYFWTHGPDSGPYRGVSGFGYRGRW